MKKKILAMAAIAIMLLVALTACGSESADISESSSSSTSNADIGMTTDDVMESLTTDDYSWNPYISVVLNKYDVDYFVNEYGNISVFCYKKTGTQELFCVLIVTHANLNNFVISKAQNAQNFLLSSASDNARYTRLQKDDDLIFSIYAPEYEESEIYDLPHTIRDVNNSDFFADEERQKTYEELFTSYQYQELEEYVNQYIDNYSPEDHDNAFRIRAIINSLTEIVNNCDIQYDEFDEKYTVYFDGADTISLSTNIVPTVCETSFIARVGFFRNNWLFFDKLSIKFLNSDEIETHHFDSWDIERNIVQGGIEEYTTISIDDKKLEKYENSDSVVLRFENTDTGEVIDHVLTDEELNGIIGAIKLRIAYVDLSNMLYRWNNC